MSWEQPGLVMSTDFDTKKVSIKNNNTEECGLLLDMPGDSDTLTYFTDRKLKHYVNGLAGDYV